MTIEIGFLLKKGISFLLMPLPLGIFLLLMGLLFLHRNNPKRAKRYLTGGLLWIALISYAPVANLFSLPLERQYPKLLKVPTEVKAILLLGGDRERRAWEAIRLYQRIPDATIITSGYALYDQLSDAEKATTLLVESGVKREDILMQKGAKDTHEEAMEIKKRLGNQPFFLVTSAYHMPRAMRLFQQEGLHPIPAPTDFNNPNEDGWGSIFSSKQLEKTEHAFHEYLGLLWLHLKG